MKTAAQKKAEKKEREKKKKEAQREEARRKKLKDQAKSEDGEKEKNEEEKGEEAPKSAAATVPDQGLFFIKPYCRWGNKTLYLKNVKMFRRAKDMAVSTLSCMGQPAFYHATVALSFRLKSTIWTGQNDVPSYKFV